MKNAIRVLFVSLLFAAAFAGCSKKAENEVLKPSTELDPATPVIWVDGSSIPLADVRAEVARLGRNLPPDIPEEHRAQIQMRLIEQATWTLIRNQLLRNAYERSGVTISQDEVDAVREKMFRSTEDLASRIADSGATVAKLNDAIRLDIFRNRMIQDKLDAEASGLNDEVARAFYDEHIAMFTKPAGRSISEILVRVKADATDEERAAARAKTEQVLRALDEGADFAAMVQDVSEAPSRNMGGQLGIVPPGKLRPELEEVLFALPEGSLSEIIELPDGFHIFKVTRYEEEEILPFEPEDDNGQHVMPLKEQILANMRMEIQRRLGNEYVAALRDKAAIRFEGPLSGMKFGAPDVEGSPADDISEPTGAAPAEGEASAAEADAQ